MREVEFSCNEEEDGAHSCESRVAAGLAFGGLEEAVERFDEAVGLAALCPGDDPVEVLSDHTGDVLHRRDLGPQDVCAPLLEHGGDDVDLLTVKNFAQMFAIEPCAGRAFGGGLGDQGVEVGSAFVGQAGTVLEQGPAQPFEARVGALFEASHLVDSGRRMGDDVELVEGNSGVGQVLGDALDESRRHVDAHRADLVGRAFVRGQIFCEAGDRFGVFALGNEHHLPLAHIGGDGQVIVATPAGRFVDRHRGHRRQIGLGQSKIDIVRTDRMDAMPGQTDQLGHGGKGHLLGHGQHQRLEQQREASEFAEPVGLVLDDLPVGQLHARRPDVQEAFVLEEVEVTQAFDLGVVDRMHARHVWHRKPRPGNEIDADGQRLLSRVEIDAVDVPRLGNAQGQFEELVLHPRTLLSSPTCARNGKAALGHQGRFAPLHGGRWPSLTADHRLAHGKGRSGRRDGLFDRTKE